MAVEYPPLLKGLLATYFRKLGGSTTWYYWVQAIYPTGRSALSGPVSVANAPAALTNDDFITVSWSPAPGAIGYDVLRNTTGTTPTGTVTVAVDINETASSFTDKGAVAQSYVVKAEYPGSV